MNTLEHTHYKNTTYISSQINDTFFFNPDSQKCEMDGYLEDMITLLLRWSIIKYQILLENERATCLCCTQSNNRLNKEMRYMKSIYICSVVPSLLAAGQQWTCWLYTLFYKKRPIFVFFLPKFEKLASRQRRTLPYKIT